MTVIGSFSVPDARKIAAHVARGRELPLGSVIQHRRPRGNPPGIYTQFIVYVRATAGQSGGIDTSGEFPVASIATYAYHCKSPDGFSYLSRTDADNNYVPGLPLRDTATAPIQPAASRIFGNEYTPAPVWSVGYAFFNEHGDFVLLWVDELPVMEEACP